MVIDYRSPCFQTSQVLIVTLLSPTCFWRKCRRMKSFIFFMCAMLGHAVVVNADDDSCPEDYLPCTCTIESAYYKIHCREDASFQEIRNVFSRIENKASYNFELSLSRGDSSTLPADLLFGKRATEITINCPTSDHKLRIDPDAFRTSRLRTEDGTFTISGCDLSELHFDFLEGFNELLVLQFTSCNFVNSNFGQFPKLRKFAVMVFANCTGLGEPTMQFPDLGHGLYALALSNTSLDDNSVSNILDWVSNMDDLTPSSDPEHKLTILTINKNRLTYIPEQIKRFQNLEQFYLTENLAELRLGTGSLSFYNKTISVSYVDLGSSQVTLIEDGAFNGNFTNAFLNLISNKMARFDESVFRPVLNNMILKDAGGVINLAENLIICDCNLAWFVRLDRAFRKHVINGKCTDDRTFNELEAHMFADCP